MENFTPWTGLLGGLLIGLAASSFVLVAGRIAGISGILGGALSSVKGDRLWRLAFIAGLVLAPLTFTCLSEVEPEIRVTGNVPLLLTAGLLVRFGTRLSSGCTSCHGVCGIARGSPRNLIATCVFFSTALATVFVHRHVLGA
jgi:uncharacterized membrane protein YedE/YeeE